MVTKAQRAPADAGTARWWPSKYGAADQATNYHQINRRHPDAGPAGLGHNSVNWIVEQVTATQQMGTHMDALNHLQMGDRTYNGFLLAVAPGLVVDKVYVGYWFWGRPSPYRLWEDLQDLLRRTKADFDPTGEQARAAWRAASAPQPVRG